MTLPTVSMGALMTTTGLTYADLVEAAGLMADRLLAAQGQVLNLNQQLGAAHGEVAALRGVLEFERERTRELRKREDDWQIVADEAPPRLGGTWPMRASASWPSLFAQLRRSIGR